MTSHRTIRKMEVKFLRAERKAIRALAALAIGAGVAGTAALTESLYEMKALLPGFESGMGGKLPPALVSDAEAAIQAVVAAGKAGPVSDRLIETANAAVIAAHNGLTGLLPADFQPLVHGTEKPPQNLF